MYMYCYGIYTLNCLNIKRACPMYMYSYGIYTLNC
jgi:hypothetical protein